MPEFSGRRRGAQVSDLILALRATDALCGQPRWPRPNGCSTSRAADRRPALDTVRTLRTAVQRMPDANLALISCGDFATAEARKALALGLHVMISPIMSDRGRSRAQAGGARARLFVMDRIAERRSSRACFGLRQRRAARDIGIIGASGTACRKCHA